MLDLIIRGGQVVTSWGVGDWDVGIQGEKIVSLAAANSITEEAGRIIDATGKIVAPGGIEPHAHIAAPIMGQGNQTTAPPEQVSRAALFGSTSASKMRPSASRKRGHCASGRYSVGQNFVMYSCLLSSCRPRRNSRRWRTPFGQFRRYFVAS